MKSVRGYVILFICLAAFVAGWMWLFDKILPPPPRKAKPEAAVIVKAKEAAAEGVLAAIPRPYQESATIVLGGMAVDSGFVRELDPFEKPIQETVTSIAGGLTSGFEVVHQLKLEGQPKLPDLPPPEPAKSFGELIAIGHGDTPFYLTALLNTRGGSVQQVVLTEFDESDREGLLVTKDGKPEPLHLVPGVRVARAASIRGQRKIPVPELKEGKFSQAAFNLTMSRPSFQMFHYEKPGDERPLTTLGDREWKFLAEESDVNPNADQQKVVFQTDLEDPYFLRITKTFTLSRKDYHIGLKVDIQRIDGKQGPNQFRYQLTGANGLPIEGEWYTSIFRQAIVGFGDEKGGVSRYIEDAPSIRLTEGGDRQTRTDKIAIRYAAVSVQFFASAIAVDDQQEKRNFIEFVRATPVGDGPPLRARTQSKDPKDWQYFDTLDDITVRAISESFDPQNTTHKYLLYHGPVKVRLLREMPQNKAVDGALVDRYLDRINLGTLTDAPMPNALGRFANAIYWSDVVIAFTNLIHSLLYELHQIIPSLAICIIVLTLIVRGILFPMSRRQAHSAQVMQAKMAKLQPELKKLQEKYGSDFQRMHSERAALMKEHGVNPFGCMGGFLLLMVQMPVMMGLYYALQESVFFRLATFLWIPNLAAPDMLIFWGESIPFISDPKDIGSTFYLGPYFNVLPCVAVGLMLIQQLKSMPKSDDPQVQSQQKMMKFMMIMMGFFFYKVAAGLCLYFITSTLWGLMERQFLPKTVKPEELEDQPMPVAGTLASKRAEQKRLEEEEAARPLGWWGRRKQKWKEEWKKVLEQAQKPQEFRRESPAQQQNSADGDKKKKKKKKR